MGYRSGWVSVLLLAAVPAWGPRAAAEGDVPRAQAAPGRVAPRVAEDAPPLPHHVRTEVRTPEGLRFVAGDLPRRLEGPKGRVPIEVSVACLRPDGSRRWVRQLGGDGDALVEGIAAAADGTCLVTGWFDGTLDLPGGRAAGTRLTARDRGDLFLVKLDRDGTVRWGRSVGGKTEGLTYSQGARVATLPDGACVVAGNFQGPATFGAGEARGTTLTSGGRPSVFLARYGADGTLAWARRVGGRVDPDRGAALATAADGSCVLVGDFRSEVRFGAGEEKETVLRAGPRRALLVARFGKDGNLAWVRAAGGSGAVAGQAAATRGDGCALVTGWVLGEVAFGTGAGARHVTSSGTVDMFLACYGADGSLRWLRTAGGDGEAYALGRGLTLPSDGSVDVTGDFGGHIAFADATGARVRLEARYEDDAFVARYAADGRFVWARRRHRDP